MPHFRATDHGPRDNMQLIDRSKRRSPWWDILFGAVILFFVRAMMLAAGLVIIKIPVIDHFAGMLAGILKSLSQ